MSSATGRSAGRDEATEAFQDAMWALMRRRRTKVAVTHKASVSSNLPGDSTVPVADGYDWMGLCLACSSLKGPTRSHWEILAHLSRRRTSYLQTQLSSGALLASVTTLWSIRLSILQRYTHRPHRPSPSVSCAGSHARPRASAPRTESNGSPAEGRRA